MKIKILTSIAAANWSYSPGQIVDITDAEAVRWINAGIAKPVKDEAETAAKEAPEKAVKSQARRKKVT